MSDFLGDFLEGPPPQPRTPPPPAPQSGPAPPPRPPRRTLEPTRRDDNQDRGSGDDYFVKPSAGERFDLPTPTGSPAAAADDVPNAAVLVAIFAALAFRLGTERNFEPYPIGTAVGAAIACGFVALGLWQVLVRRLNARVPALLIAPLAVALAVVAQATVWPHNLRAPTQADVRAAFVPLQGYTYEDAPESVLEGATTALEEDPELGKHVELIEARMVKQGRQVVAVALVIGVDPDLFDGADVQEELLSAGEELGVAARPMVLAGVPAVQWELGIGNMIAFAVEDKAMLFEVVSLPGTRTETLRDISAKLAEGNQPE